VLGLAGFTLASALCGLATSPTCDCVARGAGHDRRHATPQVLRSSVSIAPNERAFAIGSTHVHGLRSTCAAPRRLLVSLNLFGWSWRTIF